MWYAAGVLVFIALTIAAWIWQKRQRKAPRIVSFVVLLHEPKYIDEQVLAAAANRAWGAELSIGEGGEESEDGFVVASDPMNMIMYLKEMHLVNNFKSPYVENPEKLAETIADQRLSQMIAQHKAWFSCDALGVDHTTSQEEVATWYQRLGKLTAELLDENCIGIYLPEHSRIFIVKDQTEEEQLIGEKYLRRWGILSGDGGVVVD